MTMRALVGHSLPCIQIAFAKTPPDMPVQVNYDNFHHSIDSATGNATYFSQSMANGCLNGIGLSVGTGFNYDFENMDVNALGMGTTNLDVGTTFDYKQAFVEAALSIGIQPEENTNNRPDNFLTRSQGDGFPSHPKIPNIDTMSELSINTLAVMAGLFSPVLSSTSGVLSATGSAPTVPELDGVHAHHPGRPTKRKKVNEVNAAYILPEGHQRRRTKSAKAAATALALEK